uniref:Integrator complex subunit 11 n=1 Tax=Steinernema glaseri TaxID=37863 RepID=A0A1I7YGF4_9BILA
MDLTVPIYFSAGLAGRANEYYRMFINWTNEKIKKTFVKRNMFDFKHVLPFEQQYADMDGPMVVFSTPGMLHGGLSLKIFKKWCGNSNNMIIMPGYCVPGTVGAKVISGDKRVEIEGKMYDVNLGVEYMSFSAHADAKGIMQLIRTAEPKNVMLVHGENQKMEFLKEKIEKELGLPVLKPANGETVTVETQIGVDMNMPADVLDKAIMKEISANKRKCPLDACVIMDKSRKMEVISMEEAAGRMGTSLHSITFGDFVRVDHMDFKKMAERLIKHDPDLQIKDDGLELFNGEVLIMKHKEEKNKVEVLWDEYREEWSQLIIEEIKA